MAVIDIARGTVVTVEPDATLSDVVQTMRTEQVGSVIVVSADEPLGLVSDRDLAFEVLAENGATRETPVAEIVSEDFLTVPADAGVYDLVDLMSTKGVRRLPVVDDGDLVGIVSLSDVVVLLGMELQHVANTIRAVSPAYERSTMDR
ncbi:MULTISPECIES: CBS domain-containing protein [Natronorubrum]|uniref:CBS domain-containing protein n=2 Tax=Natronorubrum bangense TaxID=61858 RepID=A0A4D6HGB8_9EURY|nr:CBS domain-containing protein [Natronorubrum bangense]ELY43535.1 signal transduction protein with CBS domains [Natronorubrum bangense JCM 10635]QCC53134.1 CBS domain-containing protein [Natronorubrum bangense]QCC56174.1 CBS domain-containing protein [Natronorubrum bangense]